MTTLELHHSVSTLPIAEDMRVLIDMPIGLPSSGMRRCDLLARERLGTRRSTLFPIPARPAIYAHSYGECCETNTLYQGCRVSKQAWNLTPKIRELDLFLRAEPTRHAQIAEGHPELAFKALSSASWPLPSKRSPTGQELRQALLSEALGISAAETAREFVSNHRGQADITDAYDALSLCALLVINRGNVLFVGDGSLDEYGAPLRICIGGASNVPLQKTIEASNTGFS
jgi:predicted RNase H-like nuclease